MHYGHYGIALQKDVCLAARGPRAAISAGAIERQLVSSKDIEKPLGWHSLQKNAETM
jgi:hypothetical protein